MKPKTSFSPRCLQEWAALFLTVLFAANIPRQISAVDNPAFVGADAVGDKIQLRWSGNSSSYEIQRTTDLSAPDWKPVLATSRTNASILTAGTSGFLKIVDAKTNLTTLNLVTTNRNTGDIIPFNLQSQSSSNWVFTGPTNWNGADHVKVTVPTAAMEKVELAFDGAGGFQILTNGAPTGFGGRFESVAGPGAHEETFSGFLTNATERIEFGGTTDPLPLYVIIPVVLIALCMLESVVLLLACVLTVPAKSIACIFSGKTGKLTAGWEFNTTPTTNRWFGCIFYCDVKCE